MIPCLVYWSTTLSLYFLRIRGSWIANCSAHVRLMCGCLLPKMREYGISAQMVRWSPGRPSPNARYPHQIALLSGKVVMMASMGVSLSLRSKVGTLLSFGCLVWIMLCSPHSLSMDVSSPLRTSSLASRPITVSNVLLLRSM